MIRSSHGIVKWVQDGMPRDAPAVKTEENPKTTPAAKADEKPAAKPTAKSAVKADDKPVPAKK